MRACHGTRGARSPTVLQGDLRHGACRNAGVAIPCCRHIHRVADKPRPECQRQCQPKCFVGLSAAQDRAASERLAGLVFVSIDVNAGVFHSQSRRSQRFLGLWVLVHAGVFHVGVSTTTTLRAPSQRWARWRPPSSPRRAWNGCARREFWRSGGPSPRFEAAGAGHVHFCKLLREEEQSVVHQLVPIRRSG